MINNQLTAAEVNAKLAEGDGWMFDDETSSIHLQWIPPGRNSKPTIFPSDYCGDWQHAGPLLEKLVHDHCVSVDSYDAGEWCIAFPFKPKYLELPGSGSYWADTLTEAIARAELARREGEE